MSDARRTLRLNARPEAMPEPGLDGPRGVARRRPGCDTVEALGLPLYSAEELCDGGRQALIRLGDATYMLRITKAGKLILTK